jgi:hypothetical protein
MSKRYSPFPCLAGKVIFNICTLQMSCIAGIAWEKDVAILPTTTDEFGFQGPFCIKYADQRQKNQVVLRWVIYARLGQPHAHVQDASLKTRFLSRFLALQAIAQSSMLHAHRELKN